MVVALDPDRCEQASQVLAAAFADDPVFGWILPDPARRRRALAIHFAVETAMVAEPHGVSLVSCGDPGDPGDRVVGAALVLPPGHWRLPLGVQARSAPAYLRAFGARLPSAFGIQIVLERHHPREPHHYVPYIGVLPDQQGHGVGSQLLAPVLDRAARAHTPTYLEASNPDCRRLYERLGFRTLEEVRPLGAPPLWLMVHD